MPTPGCIRLHVFSTGAGYDAVETWRTERRIWCVRGPMTARLLGTDASLTDGAILAPDVLGRRPAIRPGARSASSRIGSRCIFRAGARRAPWRGSV